MKFLVKNWEVEKFRHLLQTEYPHRSLRDGPAPEPPAFPIDHVGVQRQKNGRNASGVAPITGRVSGTISSVVRSSGHSAASVALSL